MRASCVEGRCKGMTRHFVVNDLTPQPAGCACAHTRAQRFPSRIHVGLAESASLLLPAEGSVQWKRIDGGIRQFDKVDLVSQASFRAALPGRQVQFS